MQTLAMIKYFKGGVYSLDVGPLKPKYVKRMKASEAANLPRLAFCAGTTIFEVDAQPGWLMTYTYANATLYIIYMILISI